MAEDMYGGITYNYELKAPAALSLACWGVAGLDALVQVAVRTPTSKNQSLAVEVLATLAAGHALPQLETWIRDPALAQRIRDGIPEAVASAASSRLRGYVLSFEDDDEAASVIGRKLDQASFMPWSASRVLFQTMAARWLAISDPVLDKLRWLIAERAEDEPSFQEFLELHPQLLDPMAVEVWAQPSIHGAREPDFLIRRSDDSFLVVEIECPSKRMVTAANQLSAEATHAVSQVNEYTEFLTERIVSIRSFIANFRVPDALVIVGLESNLNDVQRRSLASENASRNKIRIAGFDWLVQRAETVNRNTVHQPPASVRRLRII